MCVCVYCSLLVRVVAYGRFPPEPRKEAHLSTKGNDNQENSQLLATSCKTRDVKYYMISLTLTACVAGES